MKKRALSLLLVLSMLVSLFSAQAAPAQQGALMDAIAAQLADSSDGWSVLDMALYSSLEGKETATSDAARQNALDALIAEAASDKATVSDRCRLELVLRAMGVDSTQLYPMGAAQPINNAALLTAALPEDLSTVSSYTVPWLLLASLQGNVKLSGSQVDSLIAVLKGAMGSDGLFGYTYDGVTYSDPDTAGAALAALAPFVGQKQEARSIADAILAALPGAMGETGSLGSANSDAMVIIGLIAIGEDPNALQNAAGASVVDGLLSSANTDGTGFLYAGQDNAMATEQGFRALVALSLFHGKALNIYDFSAAAVQSGTAAHRPLPFTDLTGCWALNNIQVVYDRGIMDGLDAAAFGPDETLDRATLAVALYRLAGSPEGYSAVSFTDVATDAPYAAAVAWAADQGLVNGVGGGRFAPQSPLTREQMAALLFRWAKVFGFSSDEAAALDSYTDAAAVSSWAGEAMAWAVGSGLITGRSADTLAPGGVSTRAEAASLLQRIMERYGV